MPWILFNAFVLALLALDLGVFNRRPRLITSREAGWWSVFWVALSLVFNLGIFLWYGPESALQFFTSYLLEKSLSADNIFIFAVIFGSMGVLAEYQHRVLFWGVLGATILGLGFSLVYLLTDSIWVVIVVHALIDLRSLIFIPIVVQGVWRKREGQASANEPESHNRVTE